MRINGWIGGAAASSLVGASFPVSEALIDYPYAAGQCVRYLAGAIILTVLLNGRLGRPTPKELGLLALVAAVGMVGFNLAVLAAERTAEPAVPGVLVGCAPVVVAVLVPLQEGRRPRRRVLYGASLVALGAFVRQVKRVQARAEDPATTGGVVVQA